MSLVLPRLWVNSQFYIPFLPGCIPYMCRAYVLCDKSPPLCAACHHQTALNALFYELSSPLLPLFFLAFTSISGRALVKLSDLWNTPIDEIICKKDVP